MTATLQVWLETAGITRETNQHNYSLWTILWFAQNNTYFVLSDHIQLKNKLMVTFPFF